MPIQDSPQKFKKRFLPWFLLGVVVFIILLPYPYEAGGPFKFLSIKYIEVHTQVSGQVKKVLVKEGEWVKKGQIIALLDTRDNQKNLDVVRADLDKVKAELRLLEAGPKPEQVEKAKLEVETAKIRYEYSSHEAERLKEMFEAGVIPQEEYNRAAQTSKVDAQNLEVEKAYLELIGSGSRPEEIEAQKALVRDLETKLKYYQENISLSELTSPIVGQIVTPYLETKVGKVLENGDLFAVLQDTRTIQAEIHIPEADIGEVSLGARVKVKLWAYPVKYFYGKVVYVAPVAENTPEGKIVRVLSEFENRDNIFKPDMTGEAKIKGNWKPIIIAFTRWLVRFFMVEVWSWFP